MRARDLAERVPMLRRETSALEAARLIASWRVASVVVAGQDGHAAAVIPGTQLLRLVVPVYVQDNKALAHVYDEAGADEICAKLRNRTVGELLEDKHLKTSDIPSVLPDDTLVEIADVMMRGHSPVVLVQEPGKAPLGVVRLARLFAGILEGAGEGGTATRATLTNDLADQDTDVHPDAMHPGSYPEGARPDVAWDAGDSTA